MRGRYYDLKLDEIISIIGQLAPLEAREGETGW